MVCSRRTRSSLQPFSSHRCTPLVRPVQPLYLIGLGLGDEKDVTVKGAETIAKCTKVFLEAYTSVLGVDAKKLVCATTLWDNCFRDQILLFSDNDSGCCVMHDARWPRRRAPTFDRSNTRWRRAGHSAVHLCTCPPRYLVYVVMHVSTFVLFGAIVTRDVVARAGRDVWQADPAR